MKKMLRRNTGVFRNTRSNNPKLLYGLVPNPIKKYNNKVRSSGSGGSINSKQLSSSYLPTSTSTTRLWIAATHVYNYMIGDSLVDWLKFIAKHKSFNKSASKYRERGTFNTKSMSVMTNNFTDYIKQKGIEFEKHIVNRIDNTIHPVEYVADYISDQTCEKTVELMRRGVPFIHSAPVRDTKLHTHGIIDLLVRSDYINNLVDIEALSENDMWRKRNISAQYTKRVKHHNSHPNYYYVVIDIKFSTIPLCSNGKNITNSGKYPAYKAQTWIYNQAISHIQGYEPRYAFILGRRVSYTQRDIKYVEHDSFNRLGVIDFEERDSDYRQKTEKSINWIKELNSHGHSWSVNPPSREELYPNMCIDSGDYQYEKEKIAENIGDITNVWYCGVKNRAFALKNGVTTWRDKACTSSLLGIGGVKGEIIDKIMNINRQSRDKIRPHRIKSNLGNWKNTKIDNELYVDFETLSDVFTDCNIIFMIGVGWVEKDDKSDEYIWKYTDFTCEQMTFEEEYRIMDKFYNFVRDRGFPRLNYWSAERKIWHNAENRQFDIHKANTNDTDSNNNDSNTDTDTDAVDICYNICENWKKIDNRWTDLLALFQTEQIVIKGCFNYRLKNIAKAMRENGLLTTEIDSECKSGLSAMTSAYNYYKLNRKEQRKNSNIMRDIKKYNEFDCKILHDILKYLRLHHK